MKIARNDTVLPCEVCGRTLLLGERASTYVLDRRAVNVCQLCVEEADARGWQRAGAPAPPPLQAPPARGGRLLRLFGAARSDPGDVDPLAAGEGPSGGPTSAGVTRDGLATFNRSLYRRTVSGISKSLGRPQVSVVPLAGTRPDVVVTVAWEISWYQYRIDASGGAIRLERRGDDIDQLDERWRHWNASVADDGRLAVAV